MRDSECAEIQHELKMSPNRDAFRFESRWAVTIDELMRHLTELDPTAIRCLAREGVDPHRVGRAAAFDARAGLTT